MASCAHQEIDCGVGIQFSHDRQVGSRSGGDFVDCSLWASAAGGRSEPSVSTQLERRVNDAQTARNHRHRSGMHRRARHHHPSRPHNEDRVNA
jgi:hypothetical protein